METSDLSKWIEHLKEPLVLVGFAIMLIAGLMRALLKKDIIRLTKAASEKVIRQLLLYAFFLGLIVIVLGFTLVFKKEAAKESGTPKEQIMQETKGGQSPAVITKEKVEIQYGGKPDKVGDDKAQSNGGGKRENKTVPSIGNIEQKTEGGQSPTVVSGGDVKIQYDKKK